MFVHPSAEVAASAAVGAGTKVWHQAQVMDGVRIGQLCVLGKGAFIGTGTTIGDRVKIGNYANLFGARVDDEAFIGPHACLMEDPTPRSTTADGRLKGPGDFVRQPVALRRGASLGAGVLLLPGVEVGAYALVAAGAVVHRDLEPHAFAAGNPARQLGWACSCGLRLNDELECACGRSWPGVGS